MKSTRGTPDPHAPSLLTEIYVRDYSRLVGLAQWVVGNRALAEEVVQDTFVRLVEEAPQLNSNDALASYVRSAVMNRSRSKVRRIVLERRHSRHQDEGLEEPEDDRHVRVAVLSLPIRQRQCVALRFYDDLSVEQIAATLGIGGGSVKTHLHRAMRALAVVLDEPALVEEQA